MADDSLRTSQVVGLFGPGAMVDLPDRSIVVGGLDRWDHRRAGSFATIEEPRLAHLLQQRLRDDPRLASEGPPEFRTPPIDPRDRGRPPPTIDSPIFPTWFVCQSLDGDPPGRRRLVPFAVLRPPRRREFVGDDGRKREATPVRFVCGCTKGHLQDIDWRRLLHSDGSSCREQMWIEETSTSADPRDTRVVCDCGRSLTLEELFQPGRLGTCDGLRPWIGDRDPTPCDAPRGLRLLTRSATNTYFPQVVSVISLPRAEDALTQRIEENLTALRGAASAAEIAIGRRMNPALTAALSGYTDEEVFVRLRQVLAGVAGADAARDPRIAEFDLFSSGYRVIGENARKALLHAETLPRDDWDPKREPLLAGIESVVAVHRLREVSCLYGFTRFEPSPQSTDEIEDVGLAVEGAPLGQAPSWLPAVEAFGEGIFLTLSPAALSAWLTRPEALGRLQQLAAGVERWRKSRAVRGFDGSDRALGERRRPEYVLVHTLSHALMTEIALESGYPASSLKERVYVPERRAGDDPKAGLLIYTASLGEQGTLGGLVEIIGRFREVLARALLRLELCSGDPICADHDPGDADEDRALHGAACHGCLLIAETSCEARNLHLDRSLLVDTVGYTGAAFFSTPLR